MLKSVTLRRKNEETMGAGQPDWNRLYKDGKLPKDQRHKVGMLPELDALDAKVKVFEEGACDECRAKFFPPVVDKAIAQGKKLEVPAAVEAPKETVQVEDKKPEPEIVTTVDLKCAHEGCEYIAHGKSEGVAGNALRMHARSHEVKA